MNGIKIDFTDLLLSQIKMEPFMHTLDFLNFAKAIQRAIYDNNCYFVKSELKSLLSNVSLFSPGLLTLANLPGVNVEVMIHWNFKDKSVAKDFLTFLKEIFEENLDHHGIHISLDNKATYIISFLIEIKSTLQKRIIGLATNTMITDQSKKYVASVMDYIAVTGLSPRSFIPTYDHYMFQGK